MAVFLWAADRSARPHALLVSGSPASPGWPRSRTPGCPCWRGSQGKGLTQIVGRSGVRQAAASATSCQVRPMHGAGSFPPGVGPIEPGQGSRAISLSLGRESGRGPGHVSVCHGRNLEGGEGYFIEQYARGGLTNDKRNRAWMSWIDAGRKNSLAPIVKGKGLGLSGECNLSNHLGIIQAGSKEGEGRPWESGEHYAVRRKLLSGYQLARLPCTPAEGRRRARLLRWRRRSSPRPSAVQPRIGTPGRGARLPLFQRFHHWSSGADCGRAARLLGAKVVAGVSSIQEVLEIRDQALSGSLTIHSRPSIAPVLAGAGARRLLPPASSLIELNPADGQREHQPAGVWHRSDPEFPDARIPGAARHPP